MRILLHSRSFLPRLGGLEQASLILARQLTRMGHQVVVATDVMAAPQFDQTLGFEVVRGRSMAELVRRARGCDVVHASGYSLVSLGVALLAGRPLVFTHHGYQSSCLEGLGWHGGERCGYRLNRCVRLTSSQRGAPRAARQLARHLAARGGLHVAAAHVAVSAFVARVIAAPRTSVIFNCADTSVFHASPVNGPRRRFLFLGRFVPEKGVHILLRAVSAAARSGADVELDLVGAGPLETSYRRLGDQLGIKARVHFRGPLRGAALADAIRESLAVVVPSVWDEAFGIVAAEAISCGRIALVSDLGGLPEVVEGLDTSVPAADVEAWTQALRRVREDDAWREQVERRLPAVAARFSPERQGQEYLRVYERALGGNMPRKASG